MVIYGIMVLGDRDGMEVRYRKSASKYLSSLDRVTQQRIKLGISGLCKNPPEGDIKRMQGTKDKSMRLRIGGYRIIYKSEGGLLSIEKIDKRGDIYK